ncbi:uncharacterized protein G2W53_014318 [Senna tora]|uniref:Reverse transcriptase domain-containing protein n=1 Tax=Senna tora TaxID=362788 RepID=A0A834WTA3_9FABA|nr:uncharacterized protein G2W53_014318 [Senna tora]
MNGNKAPGPDGMSPMFFQHCWATVHDDVIRMASSFLSRGHILRTMNQTHIALIPKNEAPRGFQDYRPISLCNTTYKIIAKVLTNRLQKVMHDVISPFQNAVVKGRLIQDNILIASEILHYIKGSKKTKGGWVALKVDLHKAYDKISWSFLEEVLSYMNFPQHWQNMLMQCVTTTSMRVKINGELTEWFTTAAGLRQGDPLSPYLYVLKNLESVSKLLSQFEDMSGLSMNKQKSKIRFSPNVSPQGAQALTRIINCRKAARTTLTKAVVSATPLYHMQHTWLSHSEAAKCDATMRDFFWGRWNDSKSPIMISWKKLCKDQRDGGMGFREMLKINEALLAKQLWRILTLEESLVSKVFLGKYRNSIHNCTFFPKPNSSSLWKKLCKVSKVVTEHIGWRVGNGEQIELYDQKWITPNYHNHHYKQLCELIHQGGYWDTDKVAQVYNPINKALVMDTVISHTDVKDKRVWLLTPNGEFSVKQAYKNITNDTQHQGNSGIKWKKLWKIPLPQKILRFWWKTLNKGLPLRENLLKKGFHIPTGCPHRNNILFQQGKSDVMECLQRAYQVMDELNGMQSLQRQDPFFHLHIPTRTNRRGGRTNDIEGELMYITCGRIKVPRSNRQAFSLSIQHEQSSRLLSYLVTNYDQNPRLAMLRSIRLFLEDYVFEQRRPIMFHIPDSTIVNQLLNLSSSN